MSENTKTGAAPKTEESWQELVKTIVYAGLIAVVIRTFLFQPFYIPSGSMEARIRGWIRLPRLSG